MDVQACLALYCFQRLITFISSKVSGKHFPFTAQVLKHIRINNNCDNKLQYMIVGLNSAECFDVRCGEWRMIAPMSTRRSSVGVGVLNGNIIFDCLYIDLFQLRVDTDKTFL